MRALIRMKVFPKEKVSSLWANEFAYNKKIIEILLNIGYEPKIPAIYESKVEAESTPPNEEGVNDNSRLEHNEIINNLTKLKENISSLENYSVSNNEPFLDFYARNAQKILGNSKECLKIFKDAPEDIQDEEKKRLIMLGYTSKGQSNFLVVAVNPEEIHIRIRQGLFNRLRACATEICDKSKKHRDRINQFFGFIQLWRKEAYLVPDSKIEVMESKRDEPTISGQIIDSALKEVYRNDKAEFILMILAAIIAIIGFVYTPSSASYFKNILDHLGGNYEVSYVQGAMERIYSAFLVTFFVTFINIIIKINSVRIDKPIVWNSGIKAERGSK